MKQFFYRSQQTAVGAVLLTVFLLLLLPETARAKLKSAIGGLFLPVLGVSTAGQSIVSSLGQAAATEPAISPENQALGQEVEAELAESDLKLENTQLRAENQRLREAVEWERRIPWKSKLTQIVGRDSFNWWRRIKLNLGSERGIRFNQPVISQGGQLVGRISEVGSKTSWAVLVGDPNCRFSALIKESRNQGGIVAPRQLSFDFRVVELTYLPNDVEVRPGQMVVTSGLGGAFPKEIPVGQVEDSWLSKDGLYIEARVKLHADLNQLEEVRVLTEF
jgi:rod shape-determining protein MreC